MNLLLRFVPFIIGFLVVYLSAKTLMKLDTTFKYIASSVLLLVMSYFFTWYNVWMMKRTGELSEKRVLSPMPLGHILNVSGALVLGYGFINNNKLVMLVSLGMVIYADTLLTKTKAKGISDNQGSTKSTPDPKEEALIRAINNKKNEDPLVGLKIGSNEILERLLQVLKSEKGVHVESLLGIIGSLAGYACNVACREMFVDTGKLKENEAFKIFECKDGKKYYFGDLLNKPLAEDKFSVWSMVSAMTEHLGGVPYDVKSTFNYVSGSIGSDFFGKPQIPDQYKLGDLPFNYVKDLWPAVLPILDKFCDQPIERPVLLAIVAQRAIEMGKDVITPSDSAKIIMECAIPMSKIGPEWLA